MYYITEKNSKSTQCNLFNAESNHKIYMKKATILFADSCLQAKGYLEVNYKLIALGVPLN